MMMNLLMWLKEPGRLIVNQSSDKALDSMVGRGKRKVLLIETLLPEFSDWLAMNREKWVELKMTWT